MGALLLLLAFAGAGPSAASGTATSVSAADGKLVFMRYANTGKGESYSLFVVASDGSGLRKVTNAYGLHPAWSPDGRKIAYEGRFSDFGPGIAIVNANGSEKRRVGAPTHEHPAYDLEPRWSPDGKRIVFVTREAASRLAIVSAHGGRWSQVPVPSRVYADEPDWSPDGERIAFVGDGGESIYVVNVDGSRLRTITRPRVSGNARRVRWSPDGKMLLFTVEGVKVGTSFEDRIYSVAPSGGSLKLVLSRAVITSASWSPDGQRIAYTGGHGCCPIHIFDLARRQDRLLNLRPCARPGSCQDLDWQHRSPSP